MIRPALLFAAAFVAQTAAAQDCPAGASTAPSIAGGTAVRVIGLSTEDAYYNGSYDTVMGLQGTTTDSLTNQGGCWYSGPVNGSNGDSYYFYKVALSTPGGSKPAVGGGSVGSTACPSNALRGAPTAGTRYRVLALHPDDAYSDGGSIVPGIDIQFGDGTTVRDGCWISGPASSSTSSDLYFFKVAVEPVGSSLVATSCPAGAHTGTIPAGSRITLLGVHPDDAYSNGAGGFGVGQTMTADAAMNNNGSCWYSGATSWNGNGSAYFYKAAFSVSGGGSTAGLPTDKAASSADVVGSIEGLAADDTLDANVESILVGAYDRDGTGTINTLNELNAIPCSVFTAVNRRYQAKWSVSVRAVLGFKSNLSWVGNAIGFTENLREPGDRQMSRCGIQ